MLIGSSFELGTEKGEFYFNPKVDEIIFNLPEASESQFYRMLGAAEQAFNKWSRTTPGERSNFFLNITDRIEAAAE